MIRTLVSGSSHSARISLESLVRSTGVAEIVSGLADLQVSDAAETVSESDLAVVVVGYHAAGGMPKPPVRGVLPANATSEELRAALEAVQAGLFVLHPDLAEAREVPDEEALLTPREREVLGMMTEGAGNREIATRLAISEHTVKFHVSGILEKLDAESRTEAVSRGLRQGLVHL